MRSWFLPCLPMMMVAVAISIPGAGPAAATNNAASDAEFHMLHQQAVSAMESLRREVNPHIIAAQYAK